MTDDELDDILNREATRRAIGQPVAVDDQAKVQRPMTPMAQERVEQIDRTITMLQTYRELVRDGLA